MRRMKRIFSIIVILCMAAALMAGCGIMQGNTPAVPTPSADANTDPAAPTQPAPASKEPVTLKIMMKSQHQFFPDDPIVKELEKRTNTKLEVEIPPYNNYTEKLKLLVAAGGELPDIITAQGSTSTDFPMLMESGAVIPVTEYFNESKNLKRVLNPTTVAAVTIQGEVWGIPKDPYIFSSGIMMRQDWLEKLGIDVGTEAEPITTEKLIEICRAFTFDDPDGNGLDDTYGFDTPVPSDTNIAGYPPTTIQAAFGAGKGWMKDQNGNLTYTTFTTEWDNMKKALEFYKSMIDQKIVHPEIFMSKTEVLRDRWYKGKTGMVAAFGSGGSYFNFMTAMKQVDPNVELVYVAGVQGPDGHHTMYKSYANASNDYLYVTKYAKDPEAAMDFLDYCVSEEGQILLFAGLEGTHYTLENGVPIRKTEEQKNAYEEFRKWYFSLEILRDYKRWDYHWELSNQGAEGEKVITWMNKSLSPEMVAENEEYGYRTPSYDMMTDINKELQQSIIKYLTGTISESDLENARNKFINSNAFITWEKEMNEWYKNR